MVKSMIFDGAVSYLNGYSPETLAMVVAIMFNDELNFVEVASMVSNGTVNF